MAYLIVGVIIAMIAGYLLGAVVGLVATFYNNHFLPDSPEIGYLRWGNFFGILFACFCVLPGAGIGAVFRLIKLAEE